MGGLLPADEGGSRDSFWPAFFPAVAWFGAKDFIFFFDCRAIISKVKTELCPDCDQ